MKPGLELCFSAVVEKYKLDRLIVVSLRNLLVEATALAEGLKLHIREGYDASFSEERISGANWAVLEADLLKGLQKNHSDIMSARGGLYWALRKPLYPFKIGAFNCPRIRAKLNVDLSLLSERVYKVYQSADYSKFASPEFLYGDWLKNSGWEKLYLDFFPAQLNIEPTNICGASCYGCPNVNLKRDRGVMQPAVYQKLFGEAKKDSLLKVEFSGIGEPLLNPNLAEMISLAKDLRTTLISSFKKMPEDDFPFSELNNVRISVDALEQETFSKVRAGCSWSNIQDILSFLHKLKLEKPDESPEVGVSFLKHKANDKHAQPFLNYWKRVTTPIFKQNFFKWPFDLEPEKVQWYQILGFNQLLGKDFEKPDLIYTPVNRRSCRHALLTMTILWTGDVVGCSFDAEGKVCFGNIKDSSILEIWNSVEMKEFRRKHLELQFSEDSICANCEDWYHPV